MTHYLQMQGESVDGLRKPAPNHFVTSSESTLQTRLKSAVSMKKLKKWKP
eukprot:CAMPEP_0202462124 /NCGR_PEP_ID=MMETSP1360-20130828/52653_1 /ASSEMBLY_ACC=CAM_ASM_000848 /TAXON_ID=515479 /ORGANISM="Licmophora paradoxa, Strain CCMP2313" /LENGTH=49 /DNA_ID= /DNA_START= /DNA_END= /DNA_ORIENTATION=